MSTAVTRPAMPTTSSGRSRSGAAACVVHRRRSDDSAAAARSPGRRGRAECRRRVGASFVTSTWPTHASGVAVTATVRNVAARRGTMAAVVGEGDLRAALRQQPAGALIVIALDTSGSMGAAERVEAATGVVLGVLAGAQRASAPLVTFGGAGRAALAPTGSIEIARRRLADLETGGTTPLAEGCARRSQSPSGAATSPTERWCWRWSPMGVPPAGIRERPERGARRRTPLLRLRGSARSWSTPRPALPASGSPLSWPSRSAADACR